MAKKHPFRCAKCESELQVYRKGKGHRLLVCPSCGILAVNPGVFKAVAKRGLKAALGELPGASLVMEGIGLASDLSKGKERSSPTTPPTASFPPAQFYKNKFTAEERVRMALGSR